MRASGDGGVAVVDVEAPRPAHATDPVRVRVRSCGICASDLHLAAWNLPVTLGHEFAGVLDDGTAVAVQPNAWCGACDRCLAGETQLCRHGASRLHGVSVDGGLADEVVVDRQLPRTARRSASIPRSARWSSRWRWASTPPAVLRSNPVTARW